MKRKRRDTRRERSAQSIAAASGRAWLPRFLELFSRFPQDSEASEKAFRLKFQNLPRALFKFTKVNENHLKNLRNGQVWMSPPSEMNDPFDATFLHSPREVFQPILNKLLIDRVIEASDSEARGDVDALGLTKEELAEIRIANDAFATFAKIGLSRSSDEAEEGKKLLPALSAITDGFLKVTLDSLSAGVQDHYLISCFCERLDSPLLWGHYADNHHGMCVEYPIREALAYDDVQARLLFPVIYTEERFDASASLRSAFNGNGPTMMNLGISSAIHKFSEWSYEREWRLIDPGAQMKARPIKMPRPTAVYCGTRLAGQARTELLSAAASVGVPVYAMGPDRKTYRMRVLGLVQDADGTPHALPEDPIERAIEQLYANRKESPIATPLPASIVEQTAAPGARAGSP